MEEDGEEDEAEGEERPESPKPEDLSISSSEIRVKSEYSSKVEVLEPMDMVTTDRSVTVSLASGQRRSHDEAMGVDEDVNVDEEDELVEKAKIPETILTTRTRGRLGVSLGRHSTGSRRLLPSTPGGSKRTRTSERFSLNIPLNNNLLLNNNNDKEKKKKKGSTALQPPAQEIPLATEVSDPLSMEDDGERGEEPSNNNSVKQPSSKSHS